MFPADSLCRLVAQALHPLSMYSNPARHSNPSMLQMAFVGHTSHCWAPPIHCVASPFCVAVGIELVVIAAVTVPSFPVVTDSAPVYNEVLELAMNDGELAV